MCLGSILSCCKRKARLVSLSKTALVGQSSVLAASRSSLVGLRIGWTLYLPAHHDLSSSSSHLFASLGELSSFPAHSDTTHKQIKNMNRCPSQWLLHICVIIIIILPLNWRNQNHAFQAWASYALHGHYQ